MEATNQFQLDRDREFQDEIEIKVLESLALRAPHFPKNVVLMSPRSEFQLKTNRDFAPGSIVTFSMVSSCNQSVAAVDKNGLVVAGQVRNFYFFRLALTKAFSFDHCFNRTNTQ